MAEDAPEPRKRSRFDVGPTDAAEPPARRSRFDVGDDRRSRSPGTPAADRTTDRERTPIKSTESPGGEAQQAKDAAARAAEAAARINASIQKSKPIQQVDVPPIRQSPATNSGAAKSPSEDPAPSGMLNAEIYQQDGDFIRDIEVNDLRNRYTLTKGSTQKMIKDETGADVTTRGNYYPDKSMATPQNPPLYLHVTSTTKDGLEKAVEKIEELMKQELPNLIDERRFRKTREEQPQVERDHLGRRKWPEERIPIDLEPIPGFNLRAQVVGSGGSYVKHIQQETRCRVQIKGRGSGFLEHETGRESDEQMYLHVAGPEQPMVDSAKEMCLSLLESVKESYEAFKDRGPPNRGGFGGGDRGGYHNRGGDRQNSGSYGGGSGYGGGSAYGGNGDSSYGAYGQNYGQGYGQQGYGDAQSPVAAPTQTGDPAEQMKQYEAWAAYYAANPSADPYAAYGGYAAMMAQYMQGYTQTAGQSQTPTNGSAPPPPPPDDANPPPPPPPPGAGGGSYSAVPPPPGV
ncbi:hypothetical protein M409DRAFT_23028 [Zasmidium cellare ATCC 36951]|uniref:K Homology domain-containing protein n=1 Tax=Zasmidium cellare ATCC 36951 TaxID=1080233 RepID=A0A6A6CID9_ZASCE|nr:uncharacterized protein M409DRAFT_23028 [Zasmidium cellare ATCC 36951]KAF2166984.1 hypothetical protein M409DRAFT_23028 [Zasmidium cellare ATCC 36951]